jgi:hypothetical protein
VKAIKALFSVPSEMDLREVSRLMREALGDSLLDEWLALSVEEDTNEVHFSNLPPDNPANVAPYAVAHRAGDHTLCPPAECVERCSTCGQPDNCGDCTHECGENPIGQALPCEHGLLVGLDAQDKRECQECDWCPRCEAVRRYDGETCTTCGREWGSE